MADSEIIVDIFKYRVKINANLLKERDIEINPTVDTTNRVDTDVVMQENVPLRVSDQLGSTSLADLILSQASIQMTTRKPDNTKKWHTAQKGRSLCSNINNSNNKHTFLDFVMNWMIIAHPEAQKYQSLQTTEGRSRGEVLEDLTSNLRE